MTLSEDRKARLMAQRPDKIGDLIPQAKDQGRAWDAEAHELAEHLEVWCHEGEIQAFLDDNESIQSLLSWSVVYLTELVVTWTTDSEASAERSSGCRRCRAASPLSNDVGPEYLRCSVHASTMCLTVMHSLLRSGQLGTHKLLLALLNEENSCYYLFWQVLTIKPRQCTEKLTHLAVGVIAYLMSEYSTESLSRRRPNGTLYRLGDLALHLGGGSDCPCEACRPSELGEMLKFLDLLPILYLAAKSKQMRGQSDGGKLGAAILVVMNRLLSMAARTAITFESAGREQINVSHPFMLDTLVTARESEESNWRVELLRKHAYIFAFGATVETLGCWIGNGGKIDHMSPNPTLSNVKSIMRDVMDNPTFRGMIPRHPKLAFVKGIVETMAEGQEPALPTESESFLHEPIFLSSRSSCACCGRKEGENGGDLKCCHGGCGGLAQYCCKEHQAEHWAVHKAFCWGKMKE